MHRPLILLIDDNPDDVVLTCRALHKCCDGNQIMIMSNAEEAQQLLFGAYAPQRADMPDLIMLDLRLHKAEGWPLIRQIRTDPRTRHIPVALVTAYREAECQCPDALSQPDFFIHKSVDSTQFNHAVETVVRTVRALQPV